ncbi:MAG: HD domain-containing protein [Clostridia bacterium]|nr:HD domain-containing protein [Clostridia bacterium]
MQIAKGHMQHGNISVYNHSLSVADTCLGISERLHIKVNKKALIRGALLHDYFLYDWHEKDKSHKWHGFIHAKRALRNAERDFDLGSIEKNMIERHMFPLNIKPPSCRESMILCIADKICAVKEMIS